MDPERDSINFCAEIGNSASQTLAMIRQVFGEEIMSCTWKFKLTETEKGEIGEKSRACSSFSLTSRGLITKNSSWQAK
jgi:hypothetical protein